MTHTIPYLDATTLDKLVPMAEATALLADALASGVAPGHSPQRSIIDVPSGELLLMPSASTAGVGVKLSTVAPDNGTHGLPRIQGVYVLFDPTTLEPVALLDAIALTNLRTPAISAVATARLAVPEASVLTVFGAGPQAFGHVLAMQAVRPIREVRVVTRRAGPGEALVDQVRALGLEATLREADAVAGADIVCACTTASEPLFDGRLLAEHAHVNAVGSHYVDRREVDTETVRTSAVVVETREVAWAEAGDLLVPLHAGEIDSTAITADLAELVQGTVQISPGRRTFFKSVGVAFEDLVVATAAVRRHLAAGEPAATRTASHL